MQELAVEGWRLTAAVFALLQHLPLQLLCMDTLMLYQPRENWSRGSFAGSRQPVPKQDTHNVILTGVQHKLALLSSYSNTVQPTSTDKKSHTSDT